MTLNQRVKFEFADLDIKGENIESYYKGRLEDFRLKNSELSYLQKIEAFLIRMSNPLSDKSEKNFKELHPPKSETDEEKELYLPINDKNEIAIQRVLSERTFIQGQIVKCEGYLKENISDDNREKLNIWIDYLKLKEKAIGEITLKVPEWNQPLIALYMKYKGIDYNDNNVKDVCEGLGYKGGISELKDKYYEFRQKENRTFPNIDLKTEKGRADAQLIRLNDLKLIMEDRKENDIEAYNSLLSDIKELNKNLGYL
jgi:hypothetical protein